MRLHRILRVQGWRSAVGAAIGALLAGVIGFGIARFAGDMIDDIIETLWGDLTCCQ